MPRPVISIITVCFNAEKYIEQTILSVIQQTYAGIEYIIIDGKSTDGTLNIIQKYQSHIAHFISEKDNGLYDAMNKGLQMATGDYVYFLNADDQLYSTDTIEKIFNTVEGADAYYGEAIFVNPEGEETGLRSEKTPHKVPEQLSWRSLQNGMVVSHQAFIVKKELSVNFDLQYKICSDIDWMIRCLKKCNNICNTHLTIAKFRTGGTSKAQQQLAWKERYRILQKHYGAFSNLMHHGYIVLRYIFSKNNY